MATEATRSQGPAPPRLQVTGWPEGTFVPDCAVAVAETAYRLRGKTPSVCRARVRTILHGHRYDGSRATRELGLEYTPVAETFARTIEWAVAEGLVTRPLPGVQGAAA